MSCKADRLSELVYSIVVFVKLYKDSVEETIKTNVTIGGQEWSNVNQSEVSSSVVQEGKAGLS